MGKARRERRGHNLRPHQQVCDGVVKGMAELKWRIWRFRNIVTRRGRIAAFALLKMRLQIHLFIDSQRLSNRMVPV